MIRCIAIDDEPLSLAQISTYISKIPYLELVGKCRDALEAMKIISETQVDLMFVDINMPDLNGLDFVRSLNQKPKVIFTTAYSEYAIEGYKVEAVDYLLKPFSFQDLLGAADRARRLIEDKPIEELKVQDNSIFVKSEYRITRIDVSDIKYVESMGEYLRIFLEGQPKPLMPLMSMKRMEEILPAKNFMRVHRSYIVNLDKIQEISRMRIIFDDVYIPVGDNYKQKFMDYINERSI